MPSLILLLLLASFAVSASAAPHGGGGGGGGHAGGYHGGGGGYRGGGYRGFHGGYGYRGGYGYGGWGWGGPGYGLFFATLPLYYSTLWWDGMPYYYADDSYYQWNSTVGQYQTVDPPSQISSQVVSQPTVTDLFAYPRNGQSSEQQAQDVRECRSWAAAQTGFAPTQPGGVPAASMQADGTVLAAPVATPPSRQEYLRAQGACLEGRGYSVK